MIFVRDVTKAYIQSIPTKLRIYYRPLKEYYTTYPEKVGFIVKAKFQIYGDPESGRYWHQTLIPSLCENILNYNQSIYYPSVRYSSSKTAATLVCTDGALTAVPASLENCEAKITKRVKCSDKQFSSKDFKSIDIIAESENVILSKNTYMEKVKVSNEIENATKAEPMRGMTSKEISQLRSDVRKLAWISSTMTSFHSSIALQRNKFQKIPPLSFFQTSVRPLPRLKKRKLPC